MTKLLDQQKQGRLGQEPLHGNYNTQNSKRAKLINVNGKGGGEAYGPCRQMEGETNPLHLLIISSLTESSSSPLYHCTLPAGHSLCN